MATEVERFATKQDLQGLRDEVREGFSRIELRLDQMERRFDQTDRRFDQMERRFDQMERRFDQQDQVNEALLPAMQAIARKVGASED